jgi:predicted GNAT family acetyltransferase
MEYKREQDKIYVQNEQNETIAQVDFPETSAGTVTITRTFVDGSLRGQGVAGALIQGVYDDAKQNGKTVRAVCSYAVKWFAEHPENCDVLAED